MATLEDKTLKSTYRSLLKVSDNGELEATEQEITDGAGNGTGVKLNTSGDVTADGTVAFGSLKDSGENITISKFVDEADGIGNNDNDTSIPTSAAVKDYVDSNVTAQDLDITDGTNTGAVDLDSQSLTFTGDAGVSATVSGQEVSFDSSALQAQITSNDSDISGLDTRLTTAETDIDTLEVASTALSAEIDAETAARIAADTTLQSNIDSEATTRAAEDTSLSAAINTEITDRISADAAQAAALTTEETARLAGDAALQTAIDNEATTRAAEDTNLHAEIDAETSARAAADVTLQANIDAEEAARIAADNTLTTAISDETTARTTADTTLQANIDAEASTRASADTALQTQITSNDTDIAGLDTRLTTAETNISGNDTDIAALDTRLTTAETNITSNDSDISGLDTRLTTAEGDITALESGKQSISEKGQPNGYASLDSNGTVPTSQLPESVTGALEFQGTWDASTNTPTLPDPTTVKGHYYKVSVEGTYLGTLYHVGDWALSDGVAWEHIHTQETVSDVFGREGSIIAQEGDYSAFYPLLSDLAATDANVLANTTKLAGIEDGADVTDATNVAAAGALMSGTAGLDDLADVSVPTPSDGQVLAYNSTSGQWEAGASAAAPVDSVNGQIGTVVLDADDIDDTATTNKFTTAADISKLAGIEAGADVTDTANVVAALTAGTNVTIAGDGTISATDTNTTYTAGTGLTLAGTEFSHSDTSAAADLTASGRTYVSGLTFDTFGHVTGYTTATETVVDTNTTYSAGAGIDLTGTTFSHSDTSTQGSVNNSGGTVIQDVTLDGYGHITGLASVNLDSRYYTEAEVNNLLAGKLSTTGKAADSNLLDGVDSSQFLRKDVDQNITPGKEIKFYSNDVLETTSAYQASLEVHQDTAGADAFMSFHVSGDYAAYFGLKGDINDFAVGGWSMGGTYHRVWHAGNDGSGSGLDADTVDGLQASQFLRSDANNTSVRIGNQITLEESSDRADLLQISSHTTGWAGLQIRNTSNEGRWSFMTDGSNAGIYDDENADWHIQCIENAQVILYYNGSDRVTTTSAGVSITGALTASGDVTAFSDARVKENVETIDSALDKVTQLRGVEYNKIGEERKSIGVIAQEVEEIIPEVVHTDEEGMKSVAYGNMVGILIEAIKDQQKQIDELKAKLDGITN